MYITNNSLCWKIFHYIIDIYVGIHSKNENVDRRCMTTNNIQRLDTIGHHEYFVAVVSPTNLLVLELLVIRVPTD